MQNKLFKVLICLCALIMFSNATLAKEYTDLTKDHWAYASIKTLSDREIVVGYPDGSYRPDEPVSRAEFATVVLKTLNQQKAPIKDTIMFKDLDIQHWAWDNIQRAVTLDLIKGYDDGTFKPEGPVTRAEALTIAVNSLTTNQISEAKAKKILSSAYADYASIPSWFVITAGKAEILAMVVKLPGQETMMFAEKPATRAGLAVLMCNMIEQARLNPNQKISDAMKPKKAQGQVLESVTVENFIATIPTGEKIPVSLIDSASSQTNTSGELFLAKIPVNLVTKDNYLIFPANTPVTGSIMKAKPGRFIIRNGQLIMETSKLKTQSEQKADFSSLVDTDYKWGFWTKLYRTIFKGAKIVINPDQTVDAILLQPIKVDLITGWVIE